jgi:hypothetical protein
MDGSNKRRHAAIASRLRIADKDFVLALPAHSLHAREEILTTNEFEGARIFYSG